MSECNEERRLCRCGMCGKLSPPSVNGLQYLCTRPVGHDGPHVACGAIEHNLATWEGPANDHRVG
jgi:hypothetical protein